MAQTIDMEEFRKGSKERGDENIMQVSDLMEKLENKMFRRSPREAGMPIHTPGHDGGCPGASDLAHMASAEQNQSQ